jgi:hypothetical protein
MKIGNLVKSIKILFNRKYVAKSSNPKLALAILREAKDLFIEDSDKYYSGMCVYIGKACDKISNKYQINIPSIKYLIPEFNRDFLDGGVGLYWWPLEDRKSRLRAFNKLIAIYEEVVNNKLKIKSE